MQLVEVEQELNLSPNGATLIISTLSCRSLQASKLPRGLPWWCVLVGWLLVAVFRGCAPRMGGGGRFRDRKVGASGAQGCSPLGVALWVCPQGRRQCVG